MLTVITGCMYSGKTTRLIEQYKNSINNDQKVLMINSVCDTRCNDEVKTHDASMVVATKLKHLDDFDRYNEYDIICIDEAQFFSDLTAVVRYLIDKLKKSVYVSGLNADYQQNIFGQIHELLCFSDMVVWCSAKCSVCGCAAHFSKRLIDNSNQCVVGASDAYTSVCREHLLVN